MFVLFSSNYSRLNNTIYNTLSARDSFDFWLIFLLYFIVNKRIITV